MTLSEIKIAIDKGQKVFWGNTGYRVIKDSIGQYLIGFDIGGRREWYCGLTERDGVTLNGKPEEFFIQEAPAGTFSGTDIRSALLILEKAPS